MIGSSQVYRRIQFYAILEPVPKDCKGCWSTSDQDDSKPWIPLAAAGDTNVPCLGSRDAGTGANQFWAVGGSSGQSDFGYLWRRSLPPARIGQLISRTNCSD